MLQDKKCKLCRREGKKLFLKGDRCESAKCSFTRRSYAPGKNKKNAGRIKLSDYALQLRAKQTCKKIYKLRETTLSKYYKAASKRKGATGEKIAQLLETRLDNVIYKLGIAPSISAARQLISHKHVLVDNKKVNIASYQVSPKQKIQVEKNSIPMLKNDIKIQDVPSWLKLNSDKFSASVLNLPDRSHLSQDVNIQSIIEFYSR